MNCVLSHPETTETKHLDIEDLEIVELEGEYFARCPNCIDGFRKYVCGQDFHTGGAIESPGTCDLCNGGGDLEIVPEKNRFISKARFDLSRDDNKLFADGETHWLPSELDSVLFFHNEKFRKMKVERFQASVRQELYIAENAKFYFSEA